MAIGHFDTQILAFYHVMKILKTWGHVLCIAPESGR
jgi:hypothetical protein